MTILRTFFVLVFASLGLGLFASDAEIEAKVTAAATRLRSEDPGVRESARKEIEQLGPPALPAVRKLRKSETDVEARGLLVEIEETIEIKDLSAGTWKSSWEAEPLEGTILRCNIAPDGKRAVTAGTDRRFLLWDCESGKVLKSLGDGTYWGGVFSPDGKIFAAYANFEGESVRAWKTADGAELTEWDRTELGDDENPLALRRDASGATLLAERDGTLAVSSTKFLEAGTRSRTGRWYVGEAGRRIGILRCGGIDAKNQITICFSLRDAADLKVIAEHTWIRNPAGGSLEPMGQFMFDGKTVAFNDGGTLRTFEAESGKSLPSVGEGILRFARSGEDWVSVHKDGSVRVWRDGKEIQRFDPGPAEFEEIQASPATILLLASCLDSHRMHVNGARDAVALDRQSGRELVKAGECVEARLRDGWLEIREVSGRMRVWQGAVLVKEWSADKADVVDLTASRIFTPSSGAHDWLAYPVEDGFVVTCHSTGSGVKLKGGHRGLVWKMEAHDHGVLAITPGNAALLDADGKTVKALATWNVAILGGRLFPPDTLMSSRPQGPTSWSLDGTRFAVVAEEELQVTSPDGIPVWKCPRPVATGDVYALSVDGKILAAGWKEGAEPVIKLWRVGEPGSIAEIRPGQEAGQVRKLQFSADGRALVVALNELLILTTDGRQIAVINHWPQTLFMEGPDCWRLSPDGTRIGCINDRGDLSVYESSGGKELGRLSEETTVVSLPGRVEFSPDSRWVVFRVGGGPLLAMDRNGSPVGDFKVKVTGLWQPFAWSGDGHLYVQTPTGLQVFHGGRLLPAAIWPELAGDGVAVSPDGRRVFVSKESAIKAWDRR